MSLQDDIGNGLVAAMKDTITAFDTLLGGAGATLYAFYQVAPHKGFDGAQSWCVIKPGASQRLRRIGTDYEVVYSYFAEFHVAPGANRGLSRTLIPDGFLAAFGEGGDDLLENHVTDSGSKLKAGGDGGVEWTDEPIGPNRRQGEIEIITHEIAVRVWRAA